MKFRTRLLVTSVAIVLVPLLLTCISFLVIGGQVEDAGNEIGILDKDSLSVSYTIENYSHITEEAIQKVKEQITQNPSKLEDKEYLDEISGELNRKFSYIIVRKDTDLYYTGNGKAAAKIFMMLPEYGNELPDSETGLYYNDMKKLVKQIDFSFSDGSDGSFFIVTSVHSLISKNVLKRMIIAFIIVLCLTSILLTRGIQKGIFTPINQLNTAMIGRAHV